MKNESSIFKVLPVFFGFFIMGFVDIVGISTNFVKKDFGLTDTMANLLPLMVFVWFAILSVPTGLLMNKLGRKKTVLLSMAITFLAMMAPFIAYYYIVALITFSLLGIGNVILQVSLNPLLTNVVRGERLTSSLTLGQFIKAISAFLGPIIAGAAAGIMGNWKLLFPIFAVITLISSLWLLMTKIEEQDVKVQTSSFSASFGLLKEKALLMLFFGIIFVVGIDVGLNITVPKFLMSRFDIPIEQAGLGISLYFIARTIGTLFGAILLVKLSAKKFFIVSVLIAIPMMVIMLLAGKLWVILAMIFIVGLAVANIFSIIFSAALQKKPDKANEISGLMIMGVAGGGVIALFMGVTADFFGQTAAMAVLLIAMGYLLYNANKLDRI